METTTMTPTHCQDSAALSQDWLWLPELQAGFQDRGGCCGSWMGPQGEAHPLPGPVSDLAHLCRTPHGSQRV